MKKYFKLFMLLALVMTFTMSCSKVPAGNVGVKFYLLGGDKGVDYEQLSPGRYWIGWNEELYLFPTFTQNYVWTAGEEMGSYNDESFNFQDRDGLELNADVGITYHIEPDKVPQIFETYKRGVEEITDIFLRNMVRDELVNACSSKDIQFIYGEGRTAIMDSVESKVRKEVEGLGIIIDKLYWIGRIKLPSKVKDAIDDKIEADQAAQKRENEVRTAQAQARIDSTRAGGEALAVLIRAKAQAEANILLSKSLTNQLVQYKAIEKWDGVRPKVESGVGSSLLIDVGGN